ncbi:asparagine synthase (glutamine-hydrolyzing) [Desulfococcaceae bacterium HSG7]|nr:asparagine synthase (glutamine-hydrolyzing) [Desulfococcaceae bacterium HSG7]
MCGIVGIYPIEELNLLDAMNKMIVHRGPDDDGHYYDDTTGVALSMQRLSIIDLESGHQPISDENNQIWVVCNGEIYNSPELRVELMERGHHFRTQNSDVEVLVHLYEDHGIDMLHQLNGMFAFVLYDRKKRLLFGARDRLGIKPLYYSHSDNTFAFASEMKALLTLPWISKELNRQSLSDYLSFQFIPAPQSPFSDIAKLPAGHRFVYSLQDKNLDISSYWKFKIAPLRLSRQEWIKRVRKELQDAVMRWSLSDVPIGVSLSGGIDSSSLVGLLATAGYNNIRTFSVGFEGEELQRYDELALARSVAERWGAEHIECRVNPLSVLEDIEKMVYHLDEPYGGGLPSWYVYRMMAKHVKVGLTGTGGDELFGNYKKAWHYQHRKQHALRALLKAILKHRSFAEAIDHFRFPHATYSWMYFRDFQKRSVLFRDTNTLDGLHPTEELIENVWLESQTQDPRDVIPLIDFPNQLAEEFLHVTDRFSMAHSIEARTPFLDHTLVETVMQIPADMRIGQTHPKQLLLDAVKDLLPEDVLHARKRGFILPLKEWTRKEFRDLIEEYLSPSYLTKQGIFSERLYKHIVLPHLRGTQNHTDFVWTLLMFQLWYNSFAKD